VCAPLALFLHFHATIESHAMLVRDHMTPRPITLSVDTDFKSALRIMQDHAIHHLPVIDRAKKLAGIVAERDLLLAAVCYLGAAVDIAQVMHRDVVTATPDMSVSAAATLMLRRKIGGLPVLDARNRVVGVITETDIFRAFVGAHRASAPHKSPAPAKPAARTADPKPAAGRPAAKNAAAKRRGAKAARAKV